jgi:hypothetical protein
MQNNFSNSSLTYVVGIVFFSSILSWSVCLRQLPSSLRDTFFAAETILIVAYILCLHCTDTDIVEFSTHHLYEAEYILFSLAFGIQISLDDGSSHHDLELRLCSGIAYVDI